MMNGSAVRRFRPLSYARDWYTRKDSNLQYPVSKTGAFAVLATRARDLPRLRFELRTFCLQDRCCLPFELSRREIGQSGRIRTCEYLLPRQARIASAVRSERERGHSCPKELASGKGFEPLFTGSEPAVLPVRRTRNSMRRLVLYSLCVRILDQTTGRERLADLQAGPPKSSCA